MPETAAFTVQDHRIIVPANSPLRSRLQVGSVTTSDIAQDIVAPAVLEADPARQNRVLTPLTGRIVRLDVHLGDHVRAGQPLVILAAPDLSSAQADDARARAQLRLTQLARDRAVAEKRIGGASDKDVEQAQADYANAAAEAARATQKLRQIGGAAGARGLTLTAPSSGIVTDLAAAPGAFWTDVTTPLLTVTDISTVWVTANVAEGDLAMVREGQPVHIGFSAYPGENVDGRVQSIGAILDPDTRRAKVRIAIANPTGRFKPGMFATVSFASSARSAPTVQTTALILKDDATMVYAEVRPWTFEAQLVETGPEQGGRTVITRGLAAGQRIIMKGGVLLDD